MAVTKAQVQVLWASESTKSVAGGAAEVSDAFLIDGTAVMATVQCKADHSGTPVAGDTVGFWLLASSGDPDATGGDDYATDNHGIFLGLIDLNADDPGSFVREIPASIKGGKLRAVNNDLGDAITASAVITETKA